jgi:peptidoglycan hydrolase-like protein with peptidoglycan-binding domain
VETGKFEVLTDQRYLKSPDCIYRGDILLYEGHHVAVNLEDGAKIPLLRRGSRGMEVRWVQERLNRHGAALAIDGQFGALTERAVREVQRIMHLEVDGVVGRETRGVLRE